MAFKIGSPTSGKVGKDKIGQAETAPPFNIKTLAYYYRQRRTK